jgi:hypothetical protein
LIITRLNHTFIRSLPALGASKSAKIRHLNTKNRETSKHLIIRYRYTVFSSEGVLWTGAKTGGSAGNQHQ